VTALASMRPKGLHLSTRGWLAAGVALSIAAALVALFVVPRQVVAPSLDSGKLSATATEQAVVARATATAPPVPASESASPPGSEPAPASAVPNAESKSLASRARPRWPAATTVVAPKSSKAAASTATAVSPARSSEATAFEPGADLAAHGAPRPAERSIDEKDPYAK